MMDQCIQLTISSDVLFYNFQDSFQQKASIKSSKFENKCII